VLDRQPEQFVQARIHRHGDDVDTRRHDLTRVDFLELEQLVDGDLFEIFLRGGSTRR
jgi:hypothetical protein